MLIDIEAMGRRLQEAREGRGLGISELEVEAEVAKSTVGRVERAERPEVSVVVIGKLAHTLRVHLPWLVFGKGPKWADIEPPPDPNIAGFVSRIDRLPGLRSWIEDNPTFKLSTIARGLEAYKHLPPESRQDGIPTGGWAAFFEDVDAVNAPELPDSHGKAKRLVRRHTGRRPRID